MRTVKNLIRISIVAIIIFLTACEKLIDFLPAKAKNCRIKEIRFFFPEQESFRYRMDFFYNKWGNPDSAVISPFQIENYNLYFLYDNKKQLKRLIEAYDVTFPALDHRFGYTNGVITSDTADSWFNAHSVTTFEYDSHGRISKTILKFLNDPNPPLIQTFQYDSQGNLMRHPILEIHYDNKLNLNQLHPIWLFLARDYSLNNPIQAVQYNNFKLPTKFAEPPPPPFGKFPFLNNFLNLLDRSEIVYDCKGDNR